MSLQFCGVIWGSDDTQTLQHEYQFCFDGKKGWKVDVDAHEYERSHFQSCCKSLEKDIVALIFL